MILRIVLFLVILIPSQSLCAQQRLTMSKLLTLRPPAAETLYYVTDPDIEGTWRYDPNDKESFPNVGTIRKSSIREVTGRFKRVYNVEEGVNVDWFRVSNNATINEAFKLALQKADRVNFGSKTYFLDTLNITSRSRVHLHFQNTTLQAVSKLTQAQVLTFENITQLRLTGQVTLDGNASKQNIPQPLRASGVAFLHILAPKQGGKSSYLEIGSLTFRNMPLCGVNIFVPNDLTDFGYDRIRVKAFREINGFNALNIQQEGYVAWGVNVRGAHRSVVIDSLYAQQDAEPWGDAPLEKSFYTFTFENQVDARVHLRKDSLYIKTLYAKYPCAMVLYTQAPNHVLVDQYIVENALRRPNVPDANAYPKMLQYNISWIGSKHTWTSYQSPRSSFRIKKLLIRGTNPLFMNQNAIHDVTGLWLNKGVKGARFDEIETDVRIKFHGDGYYFGFKEVPEGQHWVGKFISHIPAKRNYVQPLNADLNIEQLHLAQGAGVTFAMGNARIGRITQEEGTSAVFESRPNRFKSIISLYKGFIVESCEATNILWRFNWNIAQQVYANERAVSDGERYEFKNFKGKNRLQTHTTITTANGASTYVSAFKFDADKGLQATVDKFLQFVEFDWNDVQMKIEDSSPSDLTRRYFLSSAKPPLLKPASRRARQASRGWSQDWQENRFEKCHIEP